MPPQVSGVVTAPAAAGGAEAAEEAPTDAGILMWYMYLSDAVGDALVSC